MSIGKVICFIIIAASMSACGGGGGDGSSDGSGAAEGLWRGTTNTNRILAGVILDDGTYWFIYSPVGNSAVSAGFIQGNGTSSYGTFSSSNGKDFNLEGLGVTNFTLASAAKAKNSLGGTLTYSSSDTTTFISSYDTNYDLTPSLSAIAGAYSGAAVTTGGTAFATVTFSDSGTISGNDAGGCTFTGNAAPRAKGNVYNVSVTFGGGVCANGTSIVKGVAYFDADSKLITSAALNSDRTDGFIYVGTKQ